MVRECYTTALGLTHLSELTEGGKAGACGGAGRGVAQVGARPALGFFPTVPFPGFTQSLVLGRVGLELGWNWEFINH